MWRLLAFILLLPSAGWALQVQVEIRNSEVWIVRGRAAMQLTHDDKAKLQALLSPLKDRIAYYEACPEAEHCIPSIVILDLEGHRITSFQVRGGVPPPESACMSILSILWVGAKAIGAECHINPSLGEYIETDLATGRTTRDLLGYGFTPSPDGKWVAHIGWIPHFAPPPDKSNYLQIDHTTIYPLPKGTKPVAQEGIPEPPKVVTFKGLANFGIHEFRSHPSWSADSRRIALIDCTYDWTANSRTSSSAGDGTESNRNCSLVVVNLACKSVSLPLLSDVPADNLPEMRLSWESTRRVSVRVGDTTKTLTAPW